MSKLNELENIYAGLTQDAISRKTSRSASNAFDDYRQCLEPLAKPYVRDGFLDEDAALTRFLSETAALHLAVSLASLWCKQHSLGPAEGFWDVHQEARFFSWYTVPQALLSGMQSWANAHRAIRNVLQAVDLAAASSLAGLRRRSLGEFFTPTEIARHLVTLTGYDPQRIAECRVADPACGSGNLLTIVAAQTVEAVRSGSLDPIAAISGMNRAICGFDIQPFAVLLTRLQLLLVSLPVMLGLRTSAAGLLEALSFPHVQLRDPLRVPEGFWDSSGSFDVVVGNPPFLKVIKKRLPFLAHYSQVLAGQPNMYQLFLWWAIRATRVGGRIAFLIPQTIRAGQYLRELRKQIGKTCEITAITRFVDRTGVFDSVDQQMMVLGLARLPEGTEGASVAVRVSRNGQSLEHVEALYVAQDRVVRAHEGNPVWYVSDEMTDYSILTKVCNGGPVLAKVEAFEVLNGGFVWNQHKESLRDAEDENTLPLISSVSLGTHRFTFPPTDKRVSGRLFVDVTEPIGEPIHKDRVILLKRTTPRKARGRRIVAALLSDDFLAKYSAYFVENHVNLIRASQDGTPARHLIGLCAWLSSRLANFVFSMMNGSSHLSKSELGLIPIPVSLLTELSSIAAPLVTSSPEEQREVLRQIDERVFAFFGLAPEESQRVMQMVPSSI